MNQSQSQIHQSIYDSSRYQTKDGSKKPHFILLDNKQMPIKKTEQRNYYGMDYSKTNKVSIPQKSMIEKKTSKQSRLQQRPQTGIAPKDASFIKYYEENINLKKKQQQMAKQMQNLKNQLYEQSEVRRAANQRELAMLAAGKRSLWDTKHQSTQKTKNIGPKSHEATKISNLLQIIQDYKAKLMTAQAEIQNLRRQKHLLQQDGRIKQKKADQIMKDFKDSSAKVNTADLQQQLRNNIRLLQIQKQRNRYNEADIKRLETKIRTLQIREQQLDDLRIQNRTLEERVFKLTSLPAFSEVKDKIQEQSKIKQLQEKYKRINQKYNQLRNDNVKIEADYKAVSNKLIEVGSEADQLMKQNIKLKSIQKQNPIIYQLSKDPQLLGQVVYQIRNGKRSKQADSQFQRQTNDKILIQKQMLANQLTALRGKMNAMQQIWRQKQRVSLIEKQQLLNSLKGEKIGGDQARQQFKVMSKNGVPYTDDVSMFSQDVVNLPAGNNYFDVCLGELHLLQTMLAANFNMRSTDNALILATVDFYNHNTQTTRPVHGNHCNLQSEFSFKVTQDQYFFKYLNKNNFTIQIWGSEGNKRNNLGKATIQLNPLILKSRKNLAPVVSASAPVYLNKKVMGSINFVMRMRLPIFDQLQKINELDQIVSSEQAVTRKLIIQIQEGRGFAPSSNTFVYYSFRLEDLYTKTFKGTNPTWNYYKTIQMKYNNDYKNYLRKNQLQFVVLDDNAVIAREGDSDVVGTASISLIPLLQNRVIKERLPIRKGTQTVGQIDIKIFWHEQQIQQKVSNKQMKSGLEAFKEDMKKFMATYKLSPQTIFQNIDDNKTGMISFQEFFKWAQKINPRIGYQIVNQYYRQFKQPVNLTNFSARLSNQNNPQLQKTSQIAKQLSEINRLVSENTMMIKRKQSIQQYLKDKQIDSVFLDIDKSLDGRISKKQLEDFLQAHNVQMPKNQFVNGQKQISIITFIKKYQSLS